MQHCQYLIRHWAVVILTLFSLYSYASVAKSQFIVTDGENTLSCSSNFAVAGKVLSGKAIDQYARFDSQKVGPDQFRLVLHAKKSFDLYGYRLVCNLLLSGVNSYLSNGYQSWSQSGVLHFDETSAFHSPVFPNLGAVEELRKGQGHSWDLIVIAGSKKHVLLAAQTANSWPTQFQAKVVAKNKVKILIDIGNIADPIPLAAGDVAESEVLRLKFGDSVESDLIDYAKALHSRHFHHQHKPIIGWNSWYQLWDNIDQETILSNSQYFAQQFNKLIGKDASALQHFIVIDDGWSQAWGDWQENKKFAMGLSTIVNRIKSNGFKAGIWIAPFVVSHNSTVFKENPNWMVPGIQYQHPIQGVLHVLDITQEPVKQFIQNQIQTLKRSGFDLIKADFLAPASYVGSRSRSVTGIQAYRLGMSLIRQAAGEDTIIIASGAPVIPSLEYVDAWRIGPDIAFRTPSDKLGPRTVDIKNQLRNLTARWYFCFATLCDPDPVLFRHQHAPAVRLMQEMTLLPAGLLFLSDDFNQLNLQRAQQLGFTKNDILRLLNAQPGMPVNMMAAARRGYLLPVNEQRRIVDKADIAYAKHWLQKNDYYDLSIE